VRAEAGTAHLTFLDGQIGDAMDGAMREGEDVILDAVQWTEGSFEFQAGPVPPARRIQASTENLLLEAARKLDEMHAEDADGGEQRAAAFVEKQQRAGELAEAFRSAVRGQAAGRARNLWREAIFTVIAEGRVRRVILGPGERAYAEPAEPWRGGEVDPRLGQPMKTGAGPGEIEAFVRSMPLRSLGRPSSRGLRPPEAGFIHDAQGRSFWAVRHEGPESVWCVLSAVAPPARLNDLGVAEALVAGVSAEGSAVLVRSAGRPSPRLAAGLWAALIRAAAERHPGVGWIVEGRPAHDWTSLPGHVETIHPRFFGREHELRDLASSSATTLLGLHGAEVPPDLARQALELAAAGCRILVLDAWSDAELLTSVFVPAARARAAQPGGPPSRIAVVEFTEASPGASTVAMSCLYRAI